jgi:hypothetical protein
MPQQVEIHAPTSLILDVRPAGRASLSFYFRGVSRTKLLDPALAGVRVSDL